MSTAAVEGLDDDDLRGLTLGGGPWLLLECPLSPDAPAMEPMVAELRRRGLEVLLAHPERSPAFMRGPRPLERLVELGALAQLTSTSFSGRFGEPARRAAFAMLERGQGHVIASDGARRRRPPAGPAVRAGGARAALRGAAGPVRLDDRRRAGRDPRRRAAAAAPADCRAGAGLLRHGSELDDRDHGAVETQITIST